MLSYGLVDSDNQTERFSFLAVRVDKIVARAACSNPVPLVQQPFPFPACSVMNFCRCILFQTSNAAALAKWLVGEESRSIFKVKVIFLRSLFRLRFQARTLAQPTRCSFGRGRLDYRFR